LSGSRLCPWAAKITVFAEISEKKIPRHRKLYSCPGFFLFPVRQAALGFNLDRDSIVQGMNDRDSKFGVYFGKPV
jgi:hypothetical protein